MTNADRGFVYAVGLSFISGAIGVLTANAAFGCLAFGIGLIVAAFLSYIKSIVDKS